MNRAIDSYAVIGDCRSAALVSRDGSIDWLCLPRFDSPAVFASILDAERGGHFQVRPTDSFTTERRYIGDSNVLATTFPTPSGVVRLTDLMSVDSEAGKARELWPEHEVLRKLECLAGRVEVEVVFDPRFDYGRVLPTIDCRRPGLFYAEHGQGALALSTDVPMHLVDGQRGLAGTTVIAAGECRYLSMTYAYGMPAVVAPLGQHADRQIDRSVQWWNEWASANHRRLLRAVDWRVSKRGSRPTRPGRQCRRRAHLRALRAHEPV